jgi:hypothetical protein
MRRTRHDYIYHRLSKHARIYRLEQEVPLPLPTPRQPDELPLPEPERFQFERIDLRTVPSSMEMLAASWRR